MEQERLSAFVKTGCISEMVLLFLPGIIQPSPAISINCTYMYMTATVKMHLSLLGKLASIVEQCCTTLSFWTTLQRKKNDITQQWEQKKKISIGLSCCVPPPMKQLFMADLNVRIINGWLSKINITECNIDKYYGQWSVEYHVRHKFSFKT